VDENSSATRYVFKFLLSFSKVLLARYFGLLASWRDLENVTTTLKTKSSEFLRLVGEIAALQPTWKEEWEDLLLVEAEALEADSFNKSSHDSGTKSSKERNVGAPSNGLQRIPWWGSRYQRKTDRPPQVLDESSDSDTLQDLQAPPKNVAPAKKSPPQQPQKKAIPPKKSPKQVKVPAASPPKQVPAAFPPQQGIIEQAAPQNQDLVTKISELEALLRQLQPGRVPPPEQHPQAAHPKNPDYFQGPAVLQTPQKVENLTNFAADPSGHQQIGVGRGWDDTAGVIPMVQDSFEWQLKAMQIKKEAKKKYKQKYNKQTSPSTPIVLNAQQQASFPSTPNQHSAAAPPQLIPSTPEIHHHHYPPYQPPYQPPFQPPPYQPGNYYPPFPPAYGTYPPPFY
jgi:hypothetical protein